MAGPLPRALLVLGALALLGYSGCALRRALASDETRLRWRLEQLVEAFHAGEPLPILEALAPEFRETESGVARAELAPALAGWFRDHRDGRGGQRCRLHLDWKSFRYAPGAGDEAQLAIEAEFRLPPAPDPVWSVRIESTWLDQSGWQCLTATVRTRSGRPLYR